MYGLGALAYHLLSGGQFAIRHRGPLKRVLQEDVPADFVLLLERLLANHPENRPQSAHELGLELKLIRQEIDEGASVPQDHNSLIRDFNPIDGYGRDDQVKVIAMLSAYPGAGASLMALALSSSMTRSGIAHALVECPGSDSELYAQLNGARQMPNGAVYAHANGQQAAAPAWRNGKAAYYPIHPNESVNQIPEGAFASWLRKLGVPIVLLDMSSRWDEPQTREWMIRAVDHIALVVDCTPVKWSSRRQTCCMELGQAAKQRHIHISWIANRDQSFPYRKTWLSLIPFKPDVYFPDLSGPSMVNALWRGEGLPSDAQTTLRIDQAFQKWIVSIAP